MESKVLYYRTAFVQLLTLFSLFLSLGTHAQTGKLFDADKQLSSSFTTQVYLDRDGFLWVATRNGLNRYDGYQFLILKKESRKDLGMASNYVNCMMQDHNGLFYVGMYGALQTYDGERFQDVKTYGTDGTLVPCYVTSLLERRNGDMLIGTSGHGVLKMNGREEAREMDKRLREANSIHRLMEDSQGNLWILSDDQGLWRWDGKRIKRYFQDEEYRHAIFDICEYGDGHFYVATTNHGLFRLDGDTPVHIEATGNKHISSLYVNSRQHIMLGYDGSGLAIYNPKNNQLVDNPYFSRDVDLSTAKVYSICEDRNGNVWLGLLQKGIYMQPGHTMGFGYMGYKLGQRNTIGQACVTSVLGGSNGYHWIGTDRDGLYCMDDNAMPIKHFKEKFPATVLGLCEDRKGRIWLGTYKEGLGYIDVKSMTYHPYPLPQGSVTSIFDLETDGDGHLWIATMGYGLQRLDLETGDVKTYHQTDNAANDRRVNSITNDYISQVSISPDGQRIYAATSMGVCAMDIKSENWISTFGKNCPNYGTPTRIAREFGNVLYVGTNDGLVCYDLKSRRMTLKNMESGVTDNGIASIEQDKQGRLWISTDHGLCCLDPKSGKTNTYYVDNGLQSNEFSDGASWVEPNGLLVFGGLAGVTWFNPLEIHEYKWKAEVKLTGFKVDGELVTPATMSGFWKVMNTSVIASDRFVLSSSNNNFSVQFSTLTFDNPEHVVYRYRINKEDWVRLQHGNNEVTFSHMSPGEYDFCVVAEQNGIETPEHCFTVVIHAPWYRTPLAYAAYVLALVALFLWYRHQRHRKEQDRLRLQEHIHAEEMGEAKLRFFMNISHEIRTPMTLIVSPLLSLMKQDEDPHRRSVYETIRRNAERILGLINQMMDLRKIDKGQMQMRMRETDLISFVGDIYTLFTQQAKAKNIQFTYEHDALELPIWIDRDNFDKVIVNILSNAFKFTSTGGVIHIGITHDGHQATIRIYDNGEKIPEDKLERIFERFYQSPSTVNDRKVGTGIGLDLTRSLVELHHGTISAHNNKDGEGCEFVVKIPMGKDHLKPEEIVTEMEEATQTTSLFETEEEHDVAAPIAQELPKASRQQTIVIAEDDSEIRDYLVQELSDDYKVIGCENGKVALTEILKSVPDLLISDIMMPEMDGNALCSKVKGNPGTSHIPVILLTAKNRDEDQLEGLESGADAYIVKPFNMDILRRCIINLIHTHHMLRLKYGRNDQLEQKVEEVQMTSPDDKLLDRIMAVINKNIGNADLSVDAIAEEVGISRVHLHRKMKELTGQTPHDFIRNIRLKQAANLLASHNMNITEVMYACGFNNAASFSTIFKKFYGMSPREYMNEQKEGDSL